MSSEPATARWGDLVLGPALPRFALVMLGTWLTAADTLVTITMMPTIAREIGGFAWFGWTVAAFVLGSILAGATSGRLSLRVGLRRALMLGGLVYAAGCVVSAVAPDIRLFLIGRGLQGIGGGWTAGLCYVAVTALFEQRLWARVISALAGAWGVATLISPLIGGLFAEAGFWRGGFWLFALQGLAFIGVAAVLVKREPAEGPSATKPPWAQIAVLGAAIGAIAAAGVVSEPWLMAVLTVGGLILFALFLRIDAKAEGRLLPRRTADLTSAEGLGLFMIFAFCAATVGFNVYGPALMQALHGASPTVAGYVMVTEAMAWTVAAFAVSGVAAKDGGPFIAGGSALIVVGLSGLSWVTPHGPLWAIAAFALVQGTGFGLLWAVSSSRIVASAPEAERALVSSAVPTLQLVGNAVGASGAALIANLLHITETLGSPRARAEGIWLFLPFVPLAIAGALAAWRIAAMPQDNAA